MFDNVPKKYYDKDHGFLLTATQALSTARYRLIPYHDEWRCSEIMVCDRPRFNGGGYGLIGDYHRSVHNDDDLSESDLNDSVDRSRRRARKAIRDIMDCNDFEWFMTFTLDGEKIDRSDYAAFVKAVNRYMDNHVRRCGWSYLAVPEYHKDGSALHLHACVKGDRFALIDSGTVVRPDGGKPVKRATARKQGYQDSELKTVYNVTDWRLGFSTAIHTYGDRVALARYIGKYITKSDEKIGGRWYYSGGQLARPLYLYDNILFDDFVGDIEFEHEFGAFKIKYYDGGIALDRLDGSR